MWLLKKWAPFPRFQVGPNGTVDVEITGGDIQIDAVAKKITVDGSYTYIAAAPIGTAQATAKWQAKCIYDDGAGTTTITWADGDANFDNSATDLTALTYS